jgi:hypothetical protein
MEPNALPFEVKPPVVATVFVVLFILVQLVEKLFSSDAVQSWKRACARAINKGGPAFFKIDRLISDMRGVPAEADAGSVIQPTTGRAAAPGTAASDPELGPRTLQSRDTDATLVGR